MNKKKKKLTIGITTGDINGIGPEILIKAFQESLLRERIIPVVYSSPRVLNIYRKILNVDKFNYNVIQDAGQAAFRKISVIDCGGDIDRVNVGQADEQGGRIAFQCLERATEDLKAGKLDALVTLPINKKSIQHEDFQFPGHTEYLTEKDGSPDSLMLMVHDRIRVGVVTGHIPLKDVSAALSVSRIEHKIRLMHESLKRDFNVQKPRIAVLGLNPHAGDEGLLGTEETEVISAAIGKCSKLPGFVMGPYPADGFFGSANFMKFDGILAMYHDQGLIPFKLISGQTGVNFTAGLSFVRTSPDHGVAYDIAGKDIASTESFVNAIFTAVDVARTRAENTELQKNALDEEKVKSMISEES